MRKLIIFSLLAVGALFGLVWWFDVEEAGGSFSGFFQDPVGGTTSLFSRAGLVFSGWFQRAQGAVGGTPDPVAMAAGLIAQFEGFSPTAYADPPGQTLTYSIGYGHQIVSGDGFTTASTISESDALALLQADLANFVACVNSVVTYSGVTPQMQAALYSLCYNIGCGAFTNSTLVQDLNNGDPNQAQADFAVWNKAGGAVSAALSSRRTSEAAFFASGGVPTDQSDSGDGTQVATDDNSGDDATDNGDNG
jgi:lysozyme